MIYPYQCPKCENKFDVVKSMHESNRPEECQKCGCVGERIYVRPYLGDLKEFIPSFNPAFGKVVRSKAHQKQILAELKSQGKEVEEVGNENLENLHKWHDTKREDLRNEKWASADREMVYE